MRVLVLQPGSVQDVLETGPAVRALRARWPEARIAICVRPPGVPVARLLPGCDEVIAAHGVLGAIRAARGLAPDVAVAAGAGLGCRLACAVSGATVRAAPARGGRSALARALSAAAAAGAPVHDRALALIPPLAAGLPDLPPRPLVGLVPGARVETLCWGVERYAVLAGALSRAGASLVVLGERRDAPRAARLRELAGVPMVDLTGASPEAALTALAACDLVLGGDVPLVHCARALSRHALVLFGPTDPGRHAFEPTAEPLRLGLDCQPCAARAPARCPLGHHRCLGVLGASAVAEAATALLDGPGTGRYGPTRPHHGA